MDIVALDRQRSQLAGAIALIDDASFGAARSADKIFPALQHLRSLGIKALLLSGGANGTEVSDTHNLSGGVDPLPEAQIGIEDVLLIKRLQQHDQVTVLFSFANTIRNNVSAANVVAQITGAESPNEVVLVGAHLDSWQSGTGAQDNGTGVSMALEAARAMLALPRPPRRTVRFVFFGGEEQGLLGSSAYVRMRLRGAKRPESRRSYRGGHGLRHRGQQGAFCSTSVGERSTGHVEERRSLG
jgi:carboxypeptidase Q